MVHGKIVVDVTLGDVTIPIEFFVLDLESTFNAILGYPWLQDLGIMSYTIHQCLKFPYNGRVIKVKSEPIVEVHQLTAAHMTHVAIKEVVVTTTTPINIL